MMRNINDPMKQIYELAKKERPAYLYIMKPQELNQRPGEKYRVKFGFSSDVDKRATQLDMIPILVSNAFRRADIGKMESHLRDFIKSNISDLDGEYFTAVSADIEAIRLNKQFSFPDRFQIVEGEHQLRDKPPRYTLCAKWIKSHADSEKKKVLKLEKILNGRTLTIGLDDNGESCNHIDFRVPVGLSEIEPGHGYRVVSEQFMCSKCGHRFRRLHVSEQIGIYYVDDLPPSYE